jgi:hypothetical protein
VIDVPIPPERVEQRLRASMFVVRSLLFSPPWGATQPFIGRVDTGRFEMRVRHAYSNGLTRLLDGKVTRTARGARVEARFRTLWFVVLILRLAWLAVLLPAGLYLSGVVGHPQGAGSADWSAVAATLAVPVAIVALRAGIEAFARHLGDADEERMRQHLVGLLSE